MSAGVIASHYVAATSNLAVEIAADSPIAHWRLDETSGTTAADSSGNGRNGTYTNSPTVGAASLLSDGSGAAMGVAINSGQCATIASAAWMNVSTITVEALIKYAAATTEDGIVSRWTAAGLDWTLWRDSAGKISAKLSIASGATITLTGTVVAAANTLYHVVLTFDGTTLKLYVNGSLDASTATGGSGIWSGGAPIEIARYDADALTTPTATIDEVAIYSTALSSTRVAAHYAAI